MNGEGELWRKMGVREKKKVEMGMGEGELMGEREELKGGMGEKVEEEIRKILKE